MERAGRLSIRVESTLGAHGQPELRLVATSIASTTISFFLGARRSIRRTR